MLELLFSGMVFGKFVLGEFLVVVEVDEVFDVEVQ